MHVGDTSIPLISTNAVQQVLEFLMSWQELEPHPLFLLLNVRVLTLFLLHPQDEGIFGH